MTVVPPSILFAKEGWFVLFALYLLAEDGQECEILTRPKRIGLGTMYNDESAWMVPVTVNLDERTSRRSSTTLEPRRRAAQAADR
jgi:hypothetical protein